MTEPITNLTYLGRYRTIWPGGKQGSRKIVIPARAPSISMYDIYMDPDGGLVLRPAVVKTVAPVIVTEG